MGPKKKEEPVKLTKKQLAALQLEKDLKRAGDEAKRNYAQQDKLRAQAEKAARGQHDAERFDRAAEVKRLNQELSDFRIIGDELVEKRRLALLEHSKLSRWASIADATWLPHPNDEPNIHEFITMLRDEQEGVSDLIPQRQSVEAPNWDRRVFMKRIALPTGSTFPFTSGGCTTQRDDTQGSPDFRRMSLNKFLEVCVHAQQLVNNIKAFHDESFTRDKKELVEMHTRHQIEVSETILETLDSVTCLVINHLDNFFEFPNDTVLRIAPTTTSAEKKKVYSTASGGGGGDSLGVQVTDEVPQIQNQSNMTNAGNTPVIKFGLWTRDPGAHVYGGSIKYPELGIAIEPKDSQTTKLPKALGLQFRDNIVVRVMQFNFDPLSVLTPSSVGQEFYALDCVMVLESLTAPEKPKKVAEWTCRVEQAGGTRVLIRNEYPPKSEKSKGFGSTAAAASLGATTSMASGGMGSGGFSSTTSGSAGGDNELTMKITFEVPDTVALRTRQPIIGKWNPVTRIWDPCSTGRISSGSQQAGGGDGGVRKVSFLTSDLTALALVQEKGFDVPYERWHVYPYGIDQVMFVLEGREREDQNSRKSSIELRILVREQECCLLGPAEDRELMHIRGRWMPPLTLLRLISKAGYNFLLSDADAEFIDTVLPRTNALETKAYFDMSLFCLSHSFASSRHNREVEDPEMGLFRVSRQQRSEENDNELVVDVDDQEQWHSIRYEVERVVVAEFTEALEEEVPSLKSVAEHTSHLNLYTALQHVYDEGEKDGDIHFRATSANPLVQDCLFHLLLLTRPLTWG